MTSRVAHVGVCEREGAGGPAAEGARGLTDFLALDTIAGTALSPPMIYLATPRT